jgi:hypothetical protein
LIIQPLLELEDASKNTRLILDTDEEKVDMFRECLRDYIRDAYDMSIVEIRRTEDDDIEGFTLDDTQVKRKAHLKAIKFANVD